MRKLLRITEDEVIAEFLKAEFYHAEYDRDRNKFEALVHAPDLAHSAENAIRRALLFRRREHMWRELPADAQWWEIELEPQELHRINVFPRAQWRRLSDGNFQALHVAERIRVQLDDGKSSVLLAKIHILRSAMQVDGPKSTVLLIGIDEDHPLTLLEGNHRFVSSLLLPDDVRLRRLRLVCGFSSQMERCCWYKTDLPNLFHYTKNRIKHLWSREADISRLAPKAGGGANAGTYANAVSYPNAKSE
ncbi:MAG TPA: hypothetical protein VKE71_05325 [Candidatus Angelobacter sp.]|nr:hypothetical protein [Candidatus Angelobacter sp.]